MKKRCCVCDGTGFVVVLTRRDGSCEVEELGPCPRCERGETLERVHWDGGFWAKWESVRCEVAQRAAGVASRRVPLPRGESRRRMALMERAGPGRLTERLLAELYRDDDVGRREHERLLR